MNKSDSERITSILENMNYKLASKINEADLIVVNMCSIRQSAVDRVYGLISKFKKLKMKNSRLKIILTGCILKEDNKKFKKFFDFILDIKTLRNWPNFLKSTVISLPWQRYDDNCDYLKIKPKYKNNFSAFVPISNGCNNFCSYCVVPYVRGSLVCRNYKEILEEVKKLIEKGFKEIILLGQNVNDYQFKKVNFTQLLKMINALPGNFWIRFISPHPKNFSDELIETMAKCQKLVKEIHLPVQSGDNTILKKMNRNYTVSQYKNLIKKIRKKISGIKISSDIIVGFPGETKKQFQNTVKLVKEINFDKAYIAKYSPRLGTMANKLKDNVSIQEKKRRWQILEKLINSQWRHR